MRLSDWHNRVIPEPNSGCYLWEGSVVRGGYGQISRRGTLIYVHRLAWQEAKGPIPDGLLVLHRCDVRSCVNPDHLFLGTAQDNTDDMLAKGRVRPPGRSLTHCRHGHLFDKTNTLVNSRGWRRCRQCADRRRAAFIERAAS